MIKSGLKPIKFDKRDYSFKKTFGAFDISQLPKEFLLVSDVLDQGSSYKCTAYSASAVQESQHNKKFDSDWFYFQEGIVNGEQSDTGYELRIPFKTGVKKGFKTIDGELGFKESSYFRVDDPFNGSDLFDDIRIAMYIAKDTVIAGVNWKDNWNIGIIPSTGGNEIGGHAIKVAGWTNINGVEYLVIQNSYGTKFGKDGFNYFSREVVNKEFGKYGVFMWRSSATPEEIQNFNTILDLLRQLLQIMSQLLKMGKIWIYKNL